VRDRVAGVTELVSVASDGTPADNYSLNPDISADGRYVCFESFAENLVPNEVLYGFDVYVHDRETGTTEMVSVSSSEQQSRVFGSDLCAISADGRYVAFQSYAEELVPGDTNDTNEMPDVFLRDRRLGITEMISVNSQEVQGRWQSTTSSVSANGRYVAFESYADNLAPEDVNGLEDIFLRDRRAGTTIQVSVSNGGVGGNLPSHEPEISADASAVSYDSESNNLIPNDENHLYDVFVFEQ
jgi:Tol biopolymer transport system component